jgi:crotonobetainyl-CoA:carnitine CoA-transferase CaiB-like acyl-CoA transferase
MAEGIDTGRALAGVRVLDLTWVVAGPTATRMLAAWGAEVLKVEWPGRPDPIRFETPPPADIGEVPRAYSAEVSGFFNDLNANKKSITLNMRTERGLALFERLLERCDVVSENFSPAVMESWGYDYERIRSINPRVVYLSLSGYGHTGRDRYYVTYGPSAQALTGLTLGSGLPGMEPAGWGYSYMDQVAGYLGALAVTAALYERERSGAGDYIDLSQVEAGTLLSGPTLLDSAANGRTSERPGYPPGNRALAPDEPHGYSFRSEAPCAPHNAYPCAGDAENAWCVIAAADDEAWRNLCREIDESLLADGRFATNADRIANQDELDELIAEWTLGQDKYAVMERLQRAGVPCGAVQTAEDRVVSDPQLRARGVYVELEHPVLGRRIFQSVPVHMSETPPELRTHAPLLGSGNRQVFCGILGLSEDELAELLADGTLWPVDMPRPPWLDGPRSDAPGEGTQNVSSELTAG